MKKPTLFQTPLVMDEANSTIAPMRTVTAAPPQRRVVLNASSQPPLRMVSRPKGFNH